MATSRRKADKPKASIAEFLAEEGKTKKGSEKVSEVDMATTPIFKCVRCGISTMKPQDQFYKSSGSELYISNGGYAPICKTCLKELYANAITQFGSVDMAVEVCCHYLDWPYLPSMVRSARDSNPAYPLGEYASRIAFPKYSKQAFGKTLNEQLQDHRSSVEARAEQEKRWPTTSIQNMAYIKNIVGYDPFSDDTYSSSDRRFLFDTMAGYCPDDTIASDSHKLQSIITIVQLHLQAHKIGEQIFQELSKTPVDSTVINSLTTMQKNILQTVNTTAKENAISASGNGGAKTANTLSEKMKQIMDDGFQDIEVNMFNIEQSKVFREIADISLRSTINELRLEDNDYSEIVAEQLELIESLRRERDEALEENRLLKNEQVLRQQGDTQLLM